MTESFAWLEKARERYRDVAAQPLPENIMSLLRAAVADAPDTVALHFTETGTERTYRQLLDEVERLANGFRDEGIARGSHVAVMMPNVVEMPVTWLALGAIGAVMVPVNVRYTAFELHYVLTDSDASHLVIHQDFLALVGQMPSPVETLAGIVVVGEGAAAGEHARWADLVTGSPSGFVPDVEPGRDDIMNIQYTSGTTGWPKGCLLTQRYWLVCAKAYSASDKLRYRRILSCNPFFYMTPQWLMLMSFYQRATHYVAPYISLTHFTEWVGKYEIEFCWFPTDVLTHNPPKADIVLPLVRGNLAIHRPELHAELERRYGFRARAAFGMTEIGTGLIMPIEADEMTGSGSCGIAGPFREVRIADAEGSSLPPGKVGELVVRGPGIMQGYYKKPEATAQAFFDDWFRTGDLASQDEDGFFTIHGRIKEMIRRAGENISATEVEAALLSLPGIKEVAVLPAPDPVRGEEVKAYIVLDEGRSLADLPPEQIIDHCKGRLAPFKVPRLIEYWSTPLPRSTSGKVKKPDIVAGTPDMWKGCWDRVAATWL